MALLRATWRVTALGIVLGLRATAVHAEEASGTQVLFSFDRQHADAEQAPTAPPVPVVSPSVTALPQAQFQQATAQVDLAVEPASHSDGALEQSDPRRLAPSTRIDLLPRTPKETERSKALFNIPHVDSLGTAGAGLALVVGLFLLCVSLMRRGGPSPTTPLPHDAVAVLGRVPLTPKQYAHLIQVGNKLVLVAISGDRTDTIAEITDPAEVERLLVLCLRGSKQSSTADFQKLLAQMAKEPARGFLGREAAAYTRTARG